MPALPAQIPLFPLPNVVLFPGMPLPLHVFEPRYRRMLRDVLEGPSLIGMVLLRPGWERDYAGRPPVYEVGCAGQVERWEGLADGRFNIVLRGLSRFRILAERPGAEPYRVATVAALEDAPGDATALDGLRADLVRAIGRASDGPAILVMQPELTHTNFINALCQSLALEPVERQSLLDCGSIEERCRRLVEILSFKALEQTHGGPGSENVH